jgi:hypothetical protein
MAGATLDEHRPDEVNMLRIVAAAMVMAGLLLGACGHSEFAVRTMPRIAAGAVGQPVQRLQEALGVPRKIDTGPTKLIYVWFLPQVPAGAPQGFHGCELEVTVDPRSDHILGYTLSNIGWGSCVEIRRKVRIVEP